MTTTAPRYVVTVQEVEAEPLSVSQLTCEKHTGLPPDRFLALCRSGELPAKKSGHLRLVLLEDVRAWLRSRPVAKPPAPKPVDELEAVMARGGAKKAG